MNRREIILSINPCVYGLNYHDPSIAIIIDGKVAYGIEEERINGIKGSKGMFPTNSIKEGFNYCGLSWEDITGIAIGYSPKLWMKRLDLELSKIINDNMTIESCKVNYNATRIMDRIISANLSDRYLFFCDKEKVNQLISEKCGMPSNLNIPISYFEHHQSHIASSYTLSGFSEAIGVVVDGIGETAATSLWKISDNKYEKIMQLDYPNSLGYFYALATRFLGFEPWCHEGKTMALAAYGLKDQDIYSLLETIVNVNNEIYDVSRFINDNAKDFLMVDEEKAVKSLERMLGFSARKKDEPITKNHVNFAWAVQNILERCVTNLVNYAVKITGIENVCVAGGVFMNCKMNMVVRENSLAKNFYVQPLAGDLGLVIGSGMLMSECANKEICTCIDYGPDYSDDEIEQLLIARNAKYVKCDDIADNVAKLIADGKVVCWFEGRMEMGARALGSRSILADPREAGMSDKINELVKHREKWRPFACSVLEEYCSEIFENYDEGKSYPFMIEAFTVKPEWRKRIPAVIHRADNTSRPQSVNTHCKVLYHRMISYFYQLTGCPLVLNTSFNDKGQPIIMTPDLAVDFFDKIPVDALAIGHFLLLRE